MPVGKQFWDTNLWVYLFTVSTDPRDVAKQSRLLSMLAEAPDVVISAQVINELANVLLQKFGYEAGHVLKIVEQIGEAVVVQPLTLSTSKKAIDIREKLQLSWFDALIVSSALDAECTVLLSEDMQHGFVVEDKLTILNPFV